MNSRQLKFAILLAEHKNFSKVAEMLDMSQPALSKQIMNLEKDLGIKIFDRSSTPISMTHAGAFFIQEAKVLIDKEESINKTLERFKTGEIGKLTIGCSPFRNMYLMPKIIKKIRFKFPNVEIVLHESNSIQLKKDAVDGKFDFAIVNLPVDNAVFDITPIEMERLVLVVPNDMVSLIRGDYGKDFEEVLFEDCEKLPFIIVSPKQEMRQIFDKLCFNTGVKPEIATEIYGGITSAWTLAQAGVGATILPLQFVENEKVASNCTFFYLKEKNTRQPAIVTKKEQYISKYAEYAIELLTCQQ